jgi:inner membrane protein
MTIAFIEHLGIWAWFVAGAVLLALEVVAPGTFMLWFGLAAISVGLLTALFELAWQTQLIAFAVLSLIIVVCWWKLSRNWTDIMSDEPLLNRRAERHIGRVFVLDEALVQGTGHIRIDDTVWRAEGPDTMAGKSVRVVAVKGAMLVVEPVEL